MVILFVVLGLVAGGCQVKQDSNVIEMSVQDARYLLKHWTADVELAFRRGDPDAICVSEFQPASDGILKIHGKTVEELLVMRCISTPIPYCFTCYSGNE